MTEISVIKPTVGLEQDKLAPFELANRYTSGTSPFYVDGKQVGKITVTDRHTLIKIETTEKVTLAGHFSGANITIQSKGDIQLDASFDSQAALTIESINLAIGKPIECKSIQLSADTVHAQDNLIVDKMRINATVEFINEKEIKASSTTIKAAKVTQSGGCKVKNKLKIHCAEYQSSQTSVMKSGNKFVFVGEQVDSHGKFVAKGLAFFSADNVNISSQFKLTGQTDFRAGSLHVNQNGDLAVQGCENSSTLTVSNGIQVDKDARISTDRTHIMAHNIKNAGHFASTLGPLSVNQFANQGQARFKDAKVDIKYQMSGHDLATYEVIDSHLNAGLIEMKKGSKLNSDNSHIKTEIADLDDASLTDTILQAGDVSQSGEGIYKNATINFKNEYHVASNANISANKVNWRGNKLTISGAVNFSDRSEVETNSVMISGKLGLNDSDVGTVEMLSSESSTVTTKNNAKITADENLHLNGTNTFEGGRLESESIQLNGTNTLNDVTAIAKIEMVLGGVNGEKVKIDTDRLDFAADNTFKGSTILSKSSTHRGNAKFNKCEITSDFDTIESGAYVNLYNESKYKSTLTTSLGELELDGAKATLGSLDLQSGRLKSSNATIDATGSIQTNESTIIDSTDSEIKSKLGYYKGNIKSKKSKIEAEKVTIGGNNEFSDHSRVKAIDQLIVQGEQSLNTSELTAKHVIMDGKSNLNNASEIKAAQVLDVSPKAVIKSHESKLVSSDTLNLFGEVNLDRSLAQATTIEMNGKVKALKSTVCAKDTIIAKESSQSALDASSMSAKMVDLHGHIDATYSKIHAEEDINFHSRSEINAYVPSESISAGDIAKINTDVLKIDSGHEINIHSGASVKGKSVNGKSSSINICGTVAMTDSVKLDADYLVNDQGRVTSDNDISLIGAYSFTNFAGHISGKTTKVTSPASLNLMGDINGSDSLNISSFVNINTGLLRSYNVSINNLVDYNVGLILPSLPSLGAAFTSQHLVTSAKILATNFLPSQAKAIDLAFRVAPMLYSGYEFLTDKKKTWASLLPNIPTKEELSKLRLVDCIQPILKAKNMAMSVNGLYQSIDGACHQSFSLDEISSQFKMPTISQMADTAATVLGPNVSTTSLLSANAGVIASQNVIQMDMMSVNTGVSLGLQSNTHTTQTMFNYGADLGNKVNLTGTTLHNHGLIQNHDRLSANFDTIDNDDKGHIHAHNGDIHAKNFTDDGSFELEGGRAVVDNNLVVGTHAHEHLSHASVSAANLTDRGDVHISESRVAVAGKIIVDDHGALATSQSYTTANSMSNSGEFTSTDKSHLDVKEGLVNEKGGSTHQSHSSIHAGTITNNGRSDLDNAGIQSDGAFVQSSSGDLKSNSSSIEAKSESISGHLDTTDTTFKAKEDLVVNKDTTLVANKNTHFDGKNVTYSAQAENKDQISITATEKATITADANTQGKTGQIFITASTAAIQGVMAQEYISVKADHLEKANDVIAGTGTAANIQATSQLRVEIKDGLTLSQGIQRTSNVAVLASSITVNAEQHTKNDLYLEATAGDVVANADVRSDHDLALTAKNDVINNQRTLTAQNNSYVKAGHSVLNNQGVIAAGKDEYIEAEGGVVKNTAGTLQGGNFIQVHAQQGVTNEVVVTTVQGKHDKIEAYQSANIIGGKGEGHEGNGTVILTEGKLVNDASKIGATGNTVISADQGVILNARTHRYLADEHTSHCFYFPYIKETVRFYDTQVCGSNIGSTDGKLFINSAHGGVTGVAANLYSAKGTVVKAEGKVQLLDVLASSEVTKSQSTIIGLNSSTQPSNSQYSIGTQVASYGDIYVCSTTDDVVMQHATVAGKNDTIVNAGKSVINNQSVVAGGHDVLINAEGGIARNTGGTYLGGNYVQVVGKQGIINEVVVTNTRGKYGNIQVYQSANIIGGKGEGHDGNGAVLETKGKLINDASNIGAIGNTFISADQGVQSTAHTNRYLANKYSKTSGLFDQNEENVYVYDTQVCASNIGSSGGKLTIRSDHGAVTGVGAHLYSAQGTTIIAEGPVKLYDIVASREVKSEQSTWWGLGHNEQRSFDQYSVPTRLASYDNIYVCSTADVVYMRGVAITTPKKFTAEGESVTLTTSTLQHEYTNNSTGFNVSLFGQTLFNSNAPVEHAALPLSNGDPTYNHLAALANSNGGAEFALNGMNAGIDVANTTNSAIQGLRTGDLAKEGLNHFGIGNVDPSLKLTVNHSSERATGESIGEGGANVGSMELRARSGDVTLDGFDVNVTKDMSVSAKGSFVEKGKNLTSSYSQRSESVGVGVSASSGTVGDVSASVSQEHTKSNNYNNQHTNVGGVLTVNADRWVQDGATDNVGGLEGHVNQHVIKTHLSTTSSNSSSVSASTSGEFSVSANKSKSSVIKEQAGIHFTNASNEQSSPGFVAEVLDNEGGIIYGDASTNYHANKVNCKDVKESASSSGYSISGNVNDFVPSQHKNQHKISAKDDEGLQIKTVNIDATTAKHQATQHATIAMTGSGTFTADTIEGVFATNVEDSKSVDIDEVHHYRAEVPILNVKTVDQMCDNANWAKAHVTGTVYIPPGVLSDAVIAHEKLNTPEEVAAYADKIKIMKDLSNAVYGGGDIPEGYHAVDDGYYDAETDARVVAYVNDDKKELIIAFRGTASLQNVTNDDLDIARGKAPRSYNDDMRDYIKSEIKNHPDYNISFTGHSLGAAEASLGSSDFGCKAYVFDNPGIANNNHKYDMSGVTSFQSTPNIVNQSGPLTGSDHDQGNIVQLAQSDGQRVLAEGAKQLGPFGELGNSTYNHKNSEIDKQLDSYLDNQKRKAELYNSSTTPTLFKPVSNSESSPLTMPLRQAFN